MSQVTTHILDISKGKPAWGVSVILYEQIAHEWFQLAKGLSNTEGRLNNLLEEDVELAPGVYKISFDIKNYFNAEDIEAFYPIVEVIFEVRAMGHYHIPLLISPFGYSTYKGT